MTSIARIPLLLVLAIVGASNCAFSQFIYLANASNHVSAYRFDAHTTVLTQAPGSPFAAGVAPAGVAVDSGNRFVYVANSGSNDVSAYTIEAATGALPPVALSPFAAGSVPAGVAVAPASRFLYVANSKSSDVSAYTIDAATGALTPVPGSPFAAGSAPARVTVDPAGKFLYGTSVFMNTIAAAAGWRNLAIWAMPPIAYALASDTLISVVRVISRHQHPGPELAGDAATPLAILGGLILWLLRLAVAPASTMSGFQIGRAAG